VFDYQISPNKVPRTVDPAEPSRVILMITVTNKTGYDVEVRRLEFTIEGGDGPANLTEAVNLGQIRAQAGAGTRWDFFPSGTGRFSAFPDWPVTGLLAGESISFILSDVIVNRATGHAVIKITETTTTPVDTQIEVVKEDPGLAITEFLARPVQVIPNGETVLAWTTTGAGRCTLTTEHGGTVEVGLQGSRPEHPVETTRYTLSAEGRGQTIQQQITVTVATVRIVSFSAEPTQLVKGDQVTFRWLVTGATSCSLDPGGIALSPPEEGSHALPVEVSGPYTLTARGYNRTDTRSVQVFVMSATISSFTAAPRIVPPEAPVTLSWAAQWASGFEVKPPGQSLDRTESQLTVFPGQSTTYRLTALGQNPPARAVTVAVGAVIAAFGLTAHAGKPEEMVLVWQVECGSAELEVWTGDGPPPGKPAPVPPAADKVVPLTRGQLTNVRLTATGGGVTAVAMLHVAGTVVAGGAVLESLAMASPSGISTERSDVRVSWRASQGRLTGLIRDEHSSADLSGLTGQADLGLGFQVARRPLWSGDIYLRPPAAGQAGTRRADHGTADHGTADHGTADHGTADHGAESLGAWATRVLAAGDVGLRWEVNPWVVTPGT
jgi:hypothetical protein